MSVWITGARGFLGRHVANAAARDGLPVAGLGHGAWPEHASCGVEHWCNGDVTLANLDVLAERAGLPELLIHLAGGSAVAPSFRQPAEDFRRSVVTVGEVAEWMRLRSPETRLVFASSAAVYGTTHGGRFTETAACTPFSPYGYHKRMAELHFESYARNFGLRVAIVRLFSVYGTGLRKQLPWDLCSRLADNSQAVVLGGTGAEVRDWVHAEDAARLMLFAGHHASDEPLLLNGGTGLEVSVDSFARCVSAAWGSQPGAVRFSGQLRTGDPPRLVADPARCSALGFRFRWELQDGVRQYVEWYRGYCDPGRNSS
jgi:UDP-glucose 4-epimerase